MFGHWSTGCGTPAGVTAVTIQNLQYNPADLTIKKGDTVRWTNKDQTAHTSTSDDFQAGRDNPPTAWDSQPLNPGQTFDRQFDTAGTFPYHCSVHNYLKGTITVEE
ncbi:MAG: cupredoxin domain-containing protein [Thermoleophilia bacterium]